ncbi:MAG: N-acetylmuramoyl-L-alanine amidase [Treponemataceae bacterium]|nr:N-acetylmuramoyl-L-alanine amidase [Treponemataceae bacterium]
MKKYHLNLSRSVCGKFFCIFLGLVLVLPVFSEEISKKINLTEYTSAEEAEFFWDSMTGGGMFIKDGHTVSFRVNDSVILLDYNKLAVVEAPFMKDGNVYVGEDFKDCVESLLRTQAPDPFFSIGTILIDPGHGGKDPGAIDTLTVDGKKINVQEKDIVLNVGKKLYTLLKKKYPDKNIVMTRDTDVFLSLEERVEIANNIPLDEREAVLYVSIHVNAAFDKTAGGFEVWYLSPGYRRTVISGSEAEDKELLPILNSMMEEEYTTESILMAKYILDGLDSKIGSVMTNRGIKEEEWFVVRNAKMPSVLVELGFLTNPREAAILTDESYLKKIADGIYNGIVSFIVHFECSRGFTGL